MRLFARLALSGILLGGLAFFRDARAGDAPSATGDPAAAVAGALNQLRGVHLEGLSSSEKSALAERLDLAWETLFEHPALAKKAVLEVLATERDDNYLIIDLSHLLTSLDRKHLEPAAGALSRADVTANPGGTFHAAAGMAALHCGACLPAVLRILEIKDADTQIVEHALPINPELMLIFTIGQYGDDAIGPVSAKLSSDNCVVRGNAALALGWLQPLSIPGEIRRMASEDACDEARGRAWVALGLLDDPLLVRAATKRLESPPPASRIERLGMVTGLGSSFSLTAKAPLAELSADSDPDVAAGAKEVLHGLDEMEKRMNAVKMKRAMASAQTRSKIVKRLERAARDGRVDLEGGRDDLLTTLTSAEIPLLNRARAAVLGRLSDECLYEYQPMTYAVRALRGYLASNAARPAARD